MKESVNPDFQVAWRNPSTRFEEDVYCDPPTPKIPRKSLPQLRQAVASLQTDTVHVEVSEISFIEPITITVTPHRPGFNLLISTSATTSIDYGYQSGIQQPARLENVLMLLPGKEITGHCSAGAFRTVTCSFEPQYAEGILGPLANLSTSQLMRALDMRSSLITCVLLRLMNEALFPGPISNAVVQSLGNTLLVECAHWLLMPDFQLEKQGGLIAKHIETIEGYLSSLSSKSPCVSELATACGLSERYFAKLFRQHFGCSVSQYLKSVQTAKAKAYLLETDLPLKEIAHRLGFSSVSNFSFAFRAITGITPGQFRKSD